MTSFHPSPMGIIIDVSACCIEDPVECPFKTGPYPSLFSGLILESVNSAADPVSGRLTCVSLVVPFS